jgi:hypothetical protein
VFSSKSDAESKLNALKVMTPKSKDEFSESGTQKYVVIDGKIVEGQLNSNFSDFKEFIGGAKPKGLRDFVDKRLDPDDLARHQRLLRRQYFMEPPPKKY